MYIVKVSKLSMVKKEGEEFGQQSKNLDSKNKRYNIQ